MFQSRPYPAIEAVLPLGSLIGIIEGLLVLFHGSLTVIRRHQMPSAVAYGAGIVETCLLGKADCGISGPILISAHFVVRPVRGIHHMIGPEGSILAAIVKDHVIDSLFVARRTCRIGVDGNLALAVGSAHAIPFIVTVRVGAALAQAGPESGNIRHAIIAQVRLPAGLGLHRRRCEGFDIRANLVDIFSGSSVIFLDDGPVVIRSFRSKTLKVIRKRIPV